MSYKARSIITRALLLGCSFVVIAPGAEGHWDFPPPDPPFEYGNVLINRTSEKSGKKPVTFSHWIHRRHYTCRVCHGELGFEMKLNSTEITEDANRSGNYCGACHDGKAAFGHDQAHCDTCHNGDRSYGRDKFAELAFLPKARFGNGKDWVKALEQGLIKPKRYLAARPPDDIPIDKKLVLEAEWSNIPPAVFPHSAHTPWLDCNNCHPEIFNIKKKTTKHFAMTFILSGQFCGVCHLQVAFPIRDCKRCHPKMKE